MKLLNNIRIPRSLRTILMVGFFALIGIGLVAAVSIKMNAETQKVSVDIVTVDHRHAMISEQEVRDYMKEVMPSSLNYAELKELNLRDLEDALRKHPQIYDADVYRKNDGVMEVKVFQKNPIFRVFTQNHQSFYLGLHGDEIPLSEHFTARIPVVLIQKDKVNVKALSSQLLSLYAGLKGNSFMYTMVDQIVLDENGAFTLIPVMGDFKIILGTTDNLESKLKRLELLYKKKLIHKGWDYYKTIDLRFEGQVIAQKK